MKSNHMRLHLINHRSRRCKGGPADTTNVLKASTMKNKWSQTKAGLQHSLVDKTLLPTFCTFRNGNHVEISRLFKKWQTEDLQNKPCKPYILPEDIELYCMVVIWDFMQEASCVHASCVRLLYALILRVNSGSMVRHKHMEPMTWKDSVAKHDHIDGFTGNGIYCLTCRPSKLGLKCAGPVQFFLVDNISNYLIDHWHTLFSPLCAQDNINNKFLFPAIGKHGKFNFQAPFTYKNHKAACIDCIETLGLPVDPADKELYNSNCVRRGVAATLGQTLNNIMLCHNKTYGRVASSRVDLDVYCPDDVLQASGPLFGDADEINKKFQDFLFDQGSCYRRMCDTCGFPNCDCTTCGVCNAARAKGSKTKQKKQHTCLLAHYVSSTGGAPPKLGYYDEIGNTLLAEAWQAFGVDPPIFSKQHGCGYIWQS